MLAAEAIILASTSPIISQCINVTEKNRRYATFSQRLFMHVNCSKVRDINNTQAVRVATQYASAPTS